VEVAEAYYSSLSRELGLSELRGEMPKPPQFGAGGLAAEVARSRMRCPKPAGATGSRGWTQELEGGTPRRAP
jgi:hypothetical protein